MLTLTMRHHRGFLLLRQTGSPGFAAKSPIRRGKALGERQSTKTKPPHTPDAVPVLKAPFVCETTE